MASREQPAAAALSAAGLAPHAILELTIPDSTLLSHAAGRRIDPETHTIYQLNGPNPPTDPAVVSWFHSWMTGKLHQPINTSMEATAPCSYTDSSLAPEQRVKNRLARHQASVDAM